MQLGARTVLTSLFLALVATHLAGADEAQPQYSLAPLAERLVRAYHGGDAEELRPHLAPGLEFRDPKLGQELSLDGFLDMVVETAAVENDRQLEVVWTGATDKHADVRGTWSWTDVESGKRRELVFSIELGFEVSDGEPKVASWLDDFRRRRMWKPAKGDGGLETENFRVVFFRSEFSDQEAARLGETLETWYERTSRFLGRSFDEGFRLHINVAGSHDIYASDPGPEAFILVSTRSAKLDYGFTLVHELTHNLMGLSWLTRQQREHDGVELYSGNRLFDEGFAVYVEEKLTGEGPEIWPNFGQETHVGYWTAREKKGEPIWPVLEIEVHRERGDVRLAYLAQGSFVKYLVETHGLERFVRLFATDIASAGEIYGQELAELEGEWRGFLKERFGAKKKPSPTISLTSSPIADARRRSTQSFRRPGSNFARPEP
jgi:hypothetical protein